MIIKENQLLTNSIVAHEDKIQQNKVSGTTEINATVNYRYYFPYHTHPDL